MSSQKKGRGPDKEREAKKNRLLSYLRAFPSASLDRQAAYLGVTPRVVKEFHSELVEDEKRATATIVPSGHVPETFQRYLVFVETTYYLGLNKAKQSGLKE